MVEDSFVKAVLVDGADVLAVSHLGRTIPARLRTAVEELHPNATSRGVTSPATWLFGGYREDTMAVDERARLRLAEVAKRVFGDEAAITLMELLPPVGWADVATKHDLAHLETVMNLQLEAVERRFDVVDGRFDVVEQRFGAVDGRFDGVDGRLDRIESRVDDLAREIRTQTWKLMTLMVAVVGVVVAAVRL